MPNWCSLLWTTTKLAVLAGVVALGSCSTTRTILQQAPTDVPKGWAPEASQPLDAAYVRAKLQSEIYGPVQSNPSVAVEDYGVLEVGALGGTANLYQWRLALTYGDVTRPLDLVLTLPAAQPDASVILAQNFCPNDDVVPDLGVRAPDGAGFDCSGGGVFGMLMTQVFGRYIVKAPLKDIVARGYGYAAMYPSQLVPDSATRGTALLDEMFPGETNRPGALAVWSELFAVVADLIEQQHGDHGFAAYGHSRFGKTALLAGAWSDRIDAVIAHQSGTLGASNLTDGTGEPLEALVAQYPHWATPDLASTAQTPSALPVGASDLLSLLDDKPVLLGNARRDVWSDPWGAFTAAKTAWGTTFDAARPDDFQPTSNKAYWLRPGTHGVVKEDWPAFLDFLDAQMKTGAQIARP